MTYFEDLSAYQHRCAAVNVGWLDSTHEFPTDEPSDLFLGKLWEFCTVIVNPTRGLHDCELCAERTSTFVRDGVRLLLGSGEIFVFSDDHLFAAPNLIYHYVSAHKYSPPSDFVRAVESGLSPSDARYTRVLNEMHVPWRENRPVSEEPPRFAFVRTEKGIVKVEK